MEELGSIQKHLKVCIHWPSKSTSWNLFYRNILKYIFLKFAAFFVPNFFTNVNFFYFQQK